MVSEAVHIIDDDPSMRSSLMNLLEAAGLQARAYESVDRFLTEHEVALAGCLLLDVRLPGVNGLEFLAKMTELGVQLPAILITGHGDIPMTVQGMRAGAIDFLEKPFRNNEVLDAVSRAFAVYRERRRDQQSRADLETRYASLSARERQVMARITAGKMNKQVAGDLELSEITVKVHRGSLMRKMGVRTLADLVKMSERLGPSAPPAVSRSRPNRTALTTAVDAPSC